jgi:cysteinyl-tRNA synthetase
VTLKLYNTRTREKKKEFRPLDPNNVRMYVCGPTVYDYAHIGNARPVIVFDVLYRLLRHLAAKGEWDGGKGATKVTYVRNITDVDDKINARAAEEGVPIRDLTDRTLKQFQADVAVLRCLPPDVEPRATDHIDDMKRMIKTLVEKGCAYVAEDHVLFHVAAMPDYGKLSRRSLDEMQAGARVEVAPYKRDPMDFVLWKPSKEGEPGWPPPLPNEIKVPGRPGWHIECSAMADEWLWEKARDTLSENGLAHPHQFDIHGGGIDLVFPHHENEVAQSCCANDTKIMANVWMHNGFLLVEGQKMSKSLGNFVTIHELLQEWSGEELRLAMLKTHYREPINWTTARLQETRDELEEWVAACSRDDAAENLDFFSGDKNREPDADFIAALCDDLNTPDAITRIRSLYKGAIGGSNEAVRDLRSTLIWLGAYRPEYDQAYLRSDSTVVDMYLAKYQGATKTARAIVLNEYELSPANERERSRELVEAKINQIDTGMAADGVYLKLHEGGWVQLVALSPARERELEQEKADLSKEAQMLATARHVARQEKNFPEADRIRSKAARLGIALKEIKDPNTGEIVTTWEIAR